MRMGLWLFPPLPSQPHGPASNAFLVHVGPRFSAASVGFVVNRVYAAERLASTGQPRQLSSTVVFGGADGGGEGIRIRDRNWRTRGGSQVLKP